jgi:tetratricopeptide (TPR) repeat protein
MDEKEIQKILYRFSAGFLVVATVMVLKGSSGNSVPIFAFTVLLLGMASVGPSTIKTWGAKWGGDGGHIGFDRFQPTDRERELALNLSQDQVSSEIKNEGEEYIEEAKQRPPEKRSPEDYLTLATEKWRAKDYDGAFADVFSGLALDPEDTRIKATLIHRKASIYHDSGLKDLGIKFYKKAMEMDRKLSWPHHNLGTLYSEQGKLEEAKMEYEEALRLGPGLTLTIEKLESLKRKMEDEK